MSVEGLLSEVSGILASRLTIKAADQAFFGDKQVYTNVSLASTSGGAGGEKNEKKDKKKGGDELGDAIKTAQNIIDRVLTGDSANEGKACAELAACKKDIQEMKKEIAELRKLIQDLSLNASKGATAATPAKPAAPVKEASAEKDDDFDLFGSEEEDSDDEEKKKVVEERLKAYNAKKSVKPGPIAKSSVILDVKPWDDETNLEEMEKLVRSIEMDGLVWGGAKLIPIGYGIRKLQIICVIEDLKVSVDDLTEKITGDFEDHVQSVDIAAFNKI